MSAAVNRPAPATVQHVLFAIEQRYPGASRKRAVRRFAVHLSIEIDRIMARDIVAPILRDLLKRTFGARRKAGNA